MTRKSTNISSRLFLILTTMVLMLSMLMVPTHAMGPVIGALEADVTEDWSNGGTVNIPEGSMSVFPTYWNPDGSYEDGECDEGVLYRTVYKINQPIVTANGSLYHFSPNAFIGISMSEMVGAYNALATKPTDIKAWNEELLSKQAAFKAPATMPAEWGYTVSPDGLEATITYRMSAADQAALEERMNGTNNGVFYTGMLGAVLVSEKLDATSNEAVYYSVSFNSSYSIDEGASWIAQPSADAKTQLLTDKKSVEITKQIAKVDMTTGLPGTYQNADDGIIWMEPNQFAYVKITVTRPEGVLPSGIVLINDYIPASTEWGENFVGWGGTNSGVSFDSTATQTAMRELTMNKYTADFLFINGLNGTKKMEYVNNEAFGVRFTNLRVGGTIEIYLLIQAPASVDDSTTTPIEHYRLFYSNANLINFWQEDVVKYVGTQVQSQNTEWADSVDNAYGVTLNDKVYDRSEWLLNTDEFVLGLKDADVELVEGGVIDFNKYLTMDQMTGVPSAQFSFTITPGTAAAATPTSPEIKAGPSGAILKNSSVTFAATDPTYTTVQTGDVLALPANTKYAKQPVTVDLSGVVFSAPGIYRYVINETGTNPGVTNDTNTSRYLDVYVTVNETTGELEILDGAYVLHPTDELKGSAGGQYSGKDDGFTNHYDAYNLSFSKQITGNQGFRRQYFKFTVEVDGVAANSRYQVTYDNGATMGNITVDNTTYVNPSEVVADATGKVTQVFYLNDDDTITIHGIVGTATFTITDENGDYTASYTLDGGQSVTGNKITNAAMNNGNHNAEFTNYKNGTVPTGVMVEVAPYAAVFVIAVFAILMMMSRKMRRMAHEASQR